MQPNGTQIDYQQLAQALISQSSTATKAVSSTPTTTYGHGPGGLFSNPALEAPIFSAMILPNGGLMDRIPVYPSMYANPLYGIFTGVTATTGSEPTGVCDDPPVAGLSKLCMQTSYFGRQSRMTRVFDVDRMGLLQDRGEHQDFRFMGNPMAAGTQAGPTIMGMQNSSGWVNNEIGKAIFELAVSFKRDFAQEFYTGNPTNNTSGGGRQYYRGMDLLINTGYRDAMTGVACAAADSIVRGFQSQNIATAGANLVREITNMYRNLRYLATRAGLNPVKWAIAMRWSAFYEVTEVWPCAYLTYRCTNLASGSTNFVSTEAQIRMRDEMRGDVYNGGQFLYIDGERVEVVIDDAITEDGIGAGTFQSTFYFVPLTVLGGVPVTYMEYLDYSSPNGAVESAREFAPEGSYRASDNGRFLWHKKPPTNFCVQMLAKTQTRLVLRTPYLAARLTGVRYTPVQHEREPFTSSTYFANGGQTSYAGYGPSYYTPTS